MENGGQTSRVVARAELFTPPKEWLQLAHSAARAIGATIAGVDILPGSDGSPWILEVNAVPGWQALQTVTRKNISTAILDTVRQHFDSKASHQSQSISQTKVTASHLNREIVLILRTSAFRQFRRQATDLWLDVSQHRERQQAWRHAPPNFYLQHLK